MANELDELMDKDPLELSAEDLDKHIAFQRKQRGLFEAGVKPKKEKAGSVDISGMMAELIGQAKESQPQETIKRRF